MIDMRMNKWLLAGILVVLLLAGMNLVRLGDRISAIEHPAPSVATPAYIPASTPSASFSWTSAGSSTPAALVVVQGWLEGSLDASGLTPAAYEGLLAVPAPSGMAVSGPADLADGGPTAQIVTVPTNQGDLTVTMTLQSGAWICSGLVLV
jgi:hypothetical protein